LESGELTDAEVRDQLDQAIRAVVQGAVASDGNSAANDGGDGPNTGVIAVTAIVFEPLEDTGFTCNELLGPIGTGYNAVKLRLFLYNVIDAANVLLESAVEIISITPFCTTVFGFPTSTQQLSVEAVFAVAEDARGLSTTLAEVCSSSEVVRQRARMF
jgi:hypothetical protein